MPLILTKPLTEILKLAAEGERRGIDDLAMTGSEGEGDGDMRDREDMNDLGIVIRVMR